MTSHVLLIEDDRDLREVLQCHMLRRGYRVTACASLLEAREAMVHIDDAAIAPDIVVSDLGLPDGNGIDFYLEQSARFPGVNWILMSGNPDLLRLTRQQAERARGLTECVLVSKPISLQELNGFIT